MVEGKNNFPVSLQKKDVNVFNAVKIFDNDGETIHIDNGCHFNLLGNTVFADFITDSIQGKKTLFKQLIKGISLICSSFHLQSDKKCNSLLRRKFA